jgi:hypothetical protein
MMLWIVLIGCIALLINVFFYFREMKLIGETFIGMFQRKNTIQEHGAAWWMFFQDASISCLVVLLAGQGLQAFLIGSVGGALVSLILWREKIWESLTGTQNAKCINGELIPIIA